MKRYGNMNILIMFSDSHFEFHKNWRSWVDQLKYEIIIIVAITFHSQLSYYEILQKLDR